MNMKRMRGRGGHRQGGSGGGGGGGGNSSNNQPMNRNHVFDSSGPDMRLRGTAQQLFEKYLQLGRDATGSGDRVMAESYFQHAEHYFRILNAMAQAAQQSQAQQQARRPQGHQDDRGHDDRGQDEMNEGGEGESQGAVEIVQQQPSYQADNSDEQPQPVSQ
jgi:hypothetical protein